MSVTKQDIVDAYNSVYSTDNATNVQYNDLSEEEKHEALLILLANNGGTGGGEGGTTNVDFGDAITGQTLEAGGNGNLGWLSSIRKAITAITTLLTGVIANSKVTTTALTNNELRDAPIDVTLFGASDLALNETLINGEQKTKITDGVNNITLKNTTPSGTDYGLIVRNIPSGTQNVSITNNEVEISNDTNNPIPISATQLPLPTGAAQDRTGAAAPFSFRLSNGTTFINPTTPTDTQLISGSVNVNNFPATQTVNGAITANIGTTNGLALNATLTDGTTRTRLTDGTNNVAVSNTTPNSNDYGLITRVVGTTTVSVSNNINLNITPISYTINNVVLILANTEYSIILTTVRKYCFKVLSGSASIRFSNVAGKVATPTLPYYTLDSSSEEVQDFGTSYFSGTLYFASSTAGTTVLIQYWS